MCTISVVVIGWICTVAAIITVATGEGGKRGQLPSPNRPWTWSWDSRKFDEKCEHIVGEVGDEYGKDWTHVAILKIQLQVWWHEE